MAARACAKHAAWDPRVYICITNCIPEMPLSRQLVQKLMIELGRYQTDHMPRETRLCRLCKLNQVENETHFLLHCSNYSLQRQTFFSRINEIKPDIERKSTSESIKLLMNSNDYHVNKLVMKFISLWMNIRDTLLLSSESD